MVTFQHELKRGARRSLDRAPVAIALTEFRQFLAQFDHATPSELALHLIVDNSSTHSTEAILDFLAAHPLYHLHFPSTSSSWLTAVET